MFFLKIVAATAATLLAWSVFVVFTTLNGWWHEPITTDGDPRAFLAAAQRVVDAQNVGNVALVLLENGEVVAEHFAAVDQQIDRHTLFPTASMSKWITALGVVGLVQAGEINLDAPVSTYLTRWQLPESEFDQSGVTVRRLLSHTAGLADGLGFGDYTADETLPALEESLRRPRASSGRDVQIALGRAPGAEWDYSGGGYLILQLIIEEVSHQPFDMYMQSALFDPLAMSRSTYGYIGADQNRSNAYDQAGRQAPLYQYAVSAATGFATSAADMTKLVQALLHSQTSTEPLAQPTIELMREPLGTLYGIEIWGLGTILYAPTASGDYIYGHDGQNEPAINSTVRINPDTGDAIIVFASGNPTLATMLGFEWVFWQTGVPDFLGIGYVIDRGTRMLLYGGMSILVLAIAITWRMRRTNLRRDEVS